MRKIRNYSTYLYLNAKTSFNALYTYKAASLLNFITQIILILAQFYLWKAVYANTSSINNYTFTDMITYLVITFSIGRLYPFNVSSKFGRMVKNGDVIHSLLKPIGLEYQLLTDSFGELLYKLLFTATPIILTGYFLLGIKLSLAPGIVMIFCLFWVSSYLFIFALEVFIGVFSFYTQSLWGINNFKSSIINLLSGKILPLNFYPLVFRNFIYYLPFSIIYFIPISVLMGKKVNHLVVFLGIIWSSTILLFTLYKILSSIMIKKIMIQGG